MKAFYLAVFLFACGSSGNSNDNACFESAGEQNGETQACVSCIESKCASQLSTYESACATYISCICPGGTFGGSGVEDACGSDLGSACLLAGEGNVQCAEDMCTSQCGSDD
jgi:hypothetical protein